ncbi:unnamed protein product, partial [Rotaria sp. Silwood1]
MLAHSPKDRSRSPHRNNETTVNQTNSSSSSSKHLSSTIQTSNQNGTSSQIDTTSNDANTQNNNNNNNNNNKAKKENESQLRMKSLKSFIQTLINDSSSLGSTYDEQVKALENACIKEYRDISLDRIRRMIRNIFKMRKTQQSSHTTNSFLHQEHTNILPKTTTERFNSNENTIKKNRSNSTSSNTTPKTSDLVTSSASTLSALDADFLRHAFSQQFRPSLDLSAYFSAAAVAAASNGTGSTSPLFRPNFSSSNFLQSLTAPPPPISTTLVSSHTHTNGTNDSSTTNANKLSKQIKLSNSEINSIKVLVNAYREAASYLRFRHDYLNELELPTLNRFRNEGVQARYGMRPTFTTMTFPNHISIATGMYQEDHGIIHNSFYDRLLNKTIGMSNRDDGQWSDPNIEPLWITATKQKVKSAVLFWPACHNEFYGIRPLIYSWLYTDNIPFREKIDNAIGYFRELPVQLVMLYHFEPDKQGHTYGPNSPEVRDALLRLDNDTEYLLNKVKNELNDDLNIIILSDHGMTNVTKVIRPFFEKYVNRSSVESTVLSGALFNVMPRSGLTEQVHNNLSNIPNVTVYKRDEMPERFHYSKPKHRLGEITALPDVEGHIISGATTNAQYDNKGNHGWDNTLPSMQAIFMARGPSFNENVQIDSLNNVDIYHIACHILKLNPNPYATAGSLANLTSLFSLVKNDTTSSTFVPSSSTTQ